MENLAITHAPITFAEPSTGLVNISIDAGSQVNWTCFIDDDTNWPCSDYNLTWQGHGGKLFGLILLPCPVKVEEKLNRAKKS